MMKPLFASLFAIALTIPGCGKETPTLPKQSDGFPHEITGVDLDGQPMSLSDYRGKVVALSFWFTECPYCVQLFPHEKKLVEKYRDQPFVLLGANNDPTIEYARATEARFRLTWRSFYLGDPQGPIPKKFAVTGWPTTLIFDANGELRFRIGQKDPEAVDRAIDALLRQMAADRKS